MSDTTLNDSFKQETSLVQTVERALDILEVLSQSESEMGVSEIGAAVGLANGTTHRLLTTLTYRGYLKRTPETRKYTLGLRALTLVSASQKFLGPLAIPFLRQLMEVSQETANLAVLYETYVMYVEQVPSPRMVRVFTEPGNLVPLHTSGTGKVLLAYQSEEVVQSIIQQTGLPKKTPNTITDLEKLTRELQHIRQQGYATDLEEQEEGVRCLAAPVFNSDGKVIAALSISGPANRLTKNQLEGLVSHLRSIASGFSESLRSQT